MNGRSFERAGFGNLDLKQSVVNDLESLRPKEDSPFMLPRLRLLAFGWVCALSACSFIVDKSPSQCVQDSDCTAFDPLSTCQDTVCGLPPILLGQSAPQTGSNAALGLEMNRGLQIAFDVANADGGIAGRKLKLTFLDDQYDPTIAEANARTLTEATDSSDPPHCPTTANPPVAGQAAFSMTALNPGPTAVLGLVGSVGTPTMVRAAPIAVETGRLYFGAFTGAGTMLRNTMAGPCAKYIFNMRASYAQEAYATLMYFFALNVPDDAHLISFDQNDTFGDAGYNGMVAAYTALKMATPTIHRFRYTRNDVTSVPAQVTAATAYLSTLLAADPMGMAKHTIGIMMTDTYSAGTVFIKGINDWLYDQGTAAMMDGRASRLTIHFSNVSFVGPDALASNLSKLGAQPNPANGRMVPYTSNVYVSQVVPNYATDQNDILLEYRKLITAAGASPSFTSLEGFLAGRLFVLGLKNNKGAITPDNMVTAFETLPTVNLALGGSAKFSPTVHQYSQSVWGTQINSDATFSNIYFWSNNSIQIF
jgi:ABC-type branched-subunit amino acid transport system substrate-binding protein